MIYWPSKLAGEAVDRGANWAPTLGDLGDATIQGSSWALTQGDVTLSAASYTAKTTSIRVSAGTSGEHILRNTVTLSDGQILQQFAFIKVTSDE